MCERETAAIQCGRGEVQSLSVKGLLLSFPTEGEWKTTLVGGKYMC